MPHLCKDVMPATLRLCLRVHVVDYALTIAPEP